MVTSGDRDANSDLSREPIRRDAPSPRARLHVALGRARVDVQPRERPRAQCDGGHGGAAAVGRRLNDDLRAQPSRKTVASLAVEPPNPDMPRHISTGDDDLRAQPSHETVASWWLSHPILTCRVTSRQGTTTTSS